MTLFLWFLGLHVLLGIIAGEFVIYSVRKHPKPAAVSDAEYDQLLEALENRSARAGIKVVTAVFGVLSFILVFAAELSYQINKKKRS